MQPLLLKNLTIPSDTIDIVLDYLPGENRPSLARNERIETIVKQFGEAARNFVINRDLSEVIEDLPGLVSFGKLSLEQQTRHVQKLVDQGHLNEALMKVQLFPAVDRQYLAMAFLLEGRETLNSEIPENFKSVLANLDMADELFPEGIPAALKGAFIKEALARDEPERVLPCPELVRYFLLRSELANAEAAVRESGAGEEVVVAYLANNDVAAARRVAGRFNEAKIWEPITNYHIARGLRPPLARSDAITGRKRPRVKVVATEDRYKAFEFAHQILNPKVKQGKLLHLHASGGDIDAAREILERDPSLFDDFVMTCQDLKDIDPAIAVAIGHSSRLGKIVKASLENGAIKTAQHLTALITDPAIKLDMQRRIAVVNP